MTIFFLFVNPIMSNINIPRIYSGIDSLRSQMVSQMSQARWQTFQLKKKNFRERVEREVGGGIGMGKTCKPKAVSFQCMTKFTTNKK